MRHIGMEIGSKLVTKSEIFFRDENNNNITGYSCHLVALVISSLVIIGVSIRKEFSP